MYTHKPQKSTVDPLLHKSDSSLQPPASNSPIAAFNSHRVKQTTPIYFSCGVSNGKITICCQYNKKLLQPILAKKNLTIDNMFYLLKTSAPTARRYKRYIRGNNQILALVANKDSTSRIITQLKKNLASAKISDTSNIESIDASLITTHESDNYQQFKEVRKIVKSKEYLPNKQEFPYRRIISLADGSNFKYSTSMKIKKRLVNIDGVKITSADLASSDRAITQESVTSSALLQQQNLNIEIINLDNCVPFESQQVKTKYDLIIMENGLCICYGPNNACCGVKLTEKGYLYQFLINVASILDENNPNSTAILCGANNNSVSDLWDEDIEQFNLENQFFLAKKAINSAGICTGVIIKPIEKLVYNTRL